MQAVVFGARPAFIGRTGNDDFGQRLRANLVTAGVDHSAVMVDAAAGSGMSVAILDRDGNYGAVIVSGANLNIPPEGMATTMDNLGGARVLVLQNEVPHAVNVAAAKAARQTGALVVFKAAPARDNVSELLALVDVLVVNKVEASMLSGVSVSDRPSAIAAFPALGAMTRTVVITLGGEGLVVAVVGQCPVEIEALSVHVVSTHGAGDCFVGALVARLAKGDDVLTACRFANSAAGEFVSRRRF